MRSFTLLVVMAVFLSGCGQAQEEKPKKKNVVVSTESGRQYIEQGLEYLKQADVTSAIKSFDESIKQNPLNPQGYIVLGQTYMRLEDYDRAVDSFSAATRVAPNNGEVYYLLAVSHGLAGNLAEAEESAKKSMILFRLAEDQEGFARAAAILRGMNQTGETDIANMEESQDKQMTQQ